MQSRASVVFAALLFIDACASGAHPIPGEEDAGAVHPYEPPESGDWTIFVYGHADHNLSYSLVEDLAEMASAELAPTVDVIVLADYDSSQIAADDLPYPDGSQWLHVTGGGAPIEFIDVLPEQDLDDPAELAAAIARAFSTYPSDRRAVILWDHGAGWRGGYGRDSQNGTRIGEPMTVTMVADAVRRGLRAAEIDGPLDILGFDTCLMGSVEVASQFADLTKVFIAAAEIEYGPGWDYDAFFTRLSQSPTSSARFIAAEEVATWDEHHAEASVNDTALRSQVALNMAGWAGFQRTYRDFVEVLREQREGGELVARAGYFTLPAYFQDLGEVVAAPRTRDVGSFLRRLATEADPQLADASTAALSALAASIVGRSQGTLRERIGQYGLGIELPLAAWISDSALAEYRLLAPAWNREALWADALDSYVAIADSVAPTIAVTISEGEDPEFGPTHFADFTPPDSDVAEAELELAAPVPGSRDAWMLLGTMALGAVRPQGSYSLIWNHVALSIVDSVGAEHRAAPYVWRQLGSSIDEAESIPPILAIHGTLGSETGDRWASLLFQDGVGQIEHIVLYDPPVVLSLAELRQISSDPVFFPTFQRLDGKEEVLGDAVPIDSDRLQIRWSPVAAGAYGLFTLMTDVFGNTSSTIETVTVR